MMVNMVMTWYPKIIHYYFYKMISYLLLQKLR